MSHPLEALFRARGDEPKQALSQEAQAANLRAAWEHYLSPKPFRSGDLLIGRTGLSPFEDKSLVFLFVRWLDLAHEVDKWLIRDQIEKAHWNKIDCIVALLTPDGTCYFRPMDSGTFEPFEETAKC